jgi:hypothetical protein
MSTFKRKYIDDAANHSGDETSEGESDLSGDESNDSMVCDDDEVEYEDDADHSKTKHPREIKESAFKRIQKKLIGNKNSNDKLNDEARDAMKQNVKSIPLNKTEETKRPVVKMPSSKGIQESDIPPKPKNMGSQKKAATSNLYHFRMIFTNGAMFNKFLLPIANAVNELCFNLTSSADFTGIRLEAHDTYLTLANKSRYSCDIEAGVSSEKKPMTADDLNGLSFSVSAGSFMQTLNCAIIKDTVLTITKYADSPDKITFESITNENDVKTVYSCDMLAESRLQSLKEMQFNLGYHINLQLKTLKDETANAKKCGASTIFFSLFQAEDEKDDNILHSRLSVGFRGTLTSGCHDFYQSARKIERDENGKTVIEWQQSTSLTSEERQKLEMKQYSYNEYDNNKLRLFLNHMVRSLIVLDID